MKNHETVHLQATANDVVEYSTKRYIITVIRSLAGGHAWKGLSSYQDLVVCGRINTKHRVSRPQYERVTCPSCVEYILKYIK